MVFKFWYLTQMMEPHHLVVYCHIENTGRSLITRQRCSWYILRPQPIELIIKGFIEADREKIYAMTDDYRMQNMFELKKSSVDIFR